MKILAAARASEQQAHGTLTATVRHLLGREAFPWLWRCVAFLDVPFITCHAVERIQIRPLVKS
jgi:hypothetical protein